jgi:hypothetical protein
VRILCSIPSQITLSLSEEPSDLQNDKYTTACDSYLSFDSDVQPYCRKTYKGRGNIRITNKTFNIGINQMSIGNIVVNPTSDKTDKREQVLPKPGSK